MISRFISIALISLFTLSPPVVWAQKNNKDQNSEITFVRWVNQFPSPDKKSSKKGIFGRIGQFVFGNKPTILENPISVYAQSPERYWVIDQKSSAIALIEEQKGVNLRPKNKIDELPLSLVGICLLPGKGFLVTDSRVGRVYVVSEDGKNASLLNDSLTLAQPTGIAYIKARDEIWVLETKEHRIAILNTRGEVIKTIGGRGNAAGKFNFPTHIWVDADGTVYIVDSMNFRIQLFDSAGTWLSMFGKAGDATGYFARPKGIATDSHGNIYVVDALFHTIQIFNREGHFLYNFGTQGRESGDFWLPNGIYIDSNDYIYVADSYNSRVQVFQLINPD